MKCSPFEIRVAMIQIFELCFQFSSQCLKMFQPSKKAWCAYDRMPRQRSCNLLQDLFEVQQVWDNSRRFYRNWVLAFSPRGPCMVPCALDTWGGSANQRNQPNLDEQLDFKEAKTSKYCHNFSLLVVYISSTTIEYLSKLETSCSTKLSCKYQSSYQWVVHDYP